MQSSHVAKLAEMNAKRDLLNPPEPTRPVWHEVIEAVFCLAFGSACIYLMMIVGVAVGL